MNTKRGIFVVFLLFALFLMPLVHASTANSVLPGNTIGYFSFDNVDTINISGNTGTAINKHNTTNGTIISGVVTGLSGGILNQSYNFTGANTSSIVGILPGPTDLMNVSLYSSVATSAWVRSNLNSTDDIIYYWGTGASDNWYLQSNTNGSFSCVMRNTAGTRVIIASNTTSQAGDLINIICNYDGSRLTVYINGTLSGNVSQTGTIQKTTGQNMSIGGDGNTGDVYKGRIDEIAFFNSSLNSSNVADLQQCYNTSNSITGYRCLQFGTGTVNLSVQPVAPANLVSYHKFDNATISGTTDIDSAGNLNGTLTGNPTTGVTGYLLESLNFTNASAYVNYGTTNLTWRRLPATFMFATEKSANSGYVLQLGDASPNKYLSVFDNADGTLSVTCFQNDGNTGAATVITNSSKSLALGVFTQVIISLNTSGVQVYFDGVGVGTASGTCAANSGGTMANFVHHRNANDGAFSARFDEFGIWNVTLNSSQRNDAMNCFQTNVTPNGYACLNSGASTIVANTTQISWSFNETNGTSVNHNGTPTILFRWFNVTNGTGTGVNQYISNDTNFPISNNGIINLSGPNISKTGNYSLNISAKSNLTGVGDTISQYLLMNITNLAPINNWLNYTFSYTSNLSLATNCTDPDNDALTYSSNLTSYATNFANGTIYLHPTISNIGSSYALVACSDTNINTTRLVNFTVTNVAPTVQSTNLSLTTDNTTLILRANATDPENGPIGFYFTLSRNGGIVAFGFVGNFTQGVTSNFYNYTVNDGSIWNDGSYQFDVIATDFGSNSSTATSNTQQVVFPGPIVPFFDGAEYGVVTNNWTFISNGGAGTANYTTLIKYQGNKSINVTTTSFNYVLEHGLGSGVYSYDNKTFEFIVYDDNSTLFDNYTAFGIGRFGDAAQYSFAIDSATSINFYGYFINGTTRASTVARSIGWHKFQLYVQNQSLVQFYIDNIRIYSAPASSQVALSSYTSPTAIYIASGGGTSSNHSALYDNVRMYNGTPVNFTPVTVNTTILPSLPASNDTLMGMCNVTDEWQATLTYSYQWFKNGVLNSSGVYNTQRVQGISNNIANITNPVSGTWIFACFGIDGVANSTYLNSSSVTIQGSNPVIQTSMITVLSNTSNTSLQQYCNATDVDTPSIVYYYQLFKDGSAVTPITVDGNFTQGVTRNIANFTFPNNVNGTYIASCLASDGLLNSSWTNSSATIVNNPVLASSRIAPVLPYTNDSLYGYCNATDYGNQTQTYNYTWYKNGAANLSGQKSSASSSAAGLFYDNADNGALPTANGWIFADYTTDQAFSGNASIQPFGGTATLSTSNITKYGYTYPIRLTGVFYDTVGSGDGTVQFTEDNVSCGDIIASGGGVCPSNQYGFQVPSTCACINGFGPRTTGWHSYSITYYNRTWVEAIVDSTTIFNASTNGTDPNRVLLSGSAQPWYVDNINVTQTVSTLLPAGVEQLVSTLGQGNLTPGQNWTLQCIANDGTLFSNFLNSSIVTIQNSAPVVAAANITPDPAYANSTLLEYCNATDSDGGTLQYFYQWFKNGVSVTPVLQHPDICYQETANVSTACGGNSNGTYSVTGFPNNTAPIDGDYATSSQPPNAGIAFLLANYTLPASSSISGTLWQIKTLNGTTNQSVATCNVTNGILQVRITATTSNVTGNQSVYACVVGTAFSTLATVSTSSTIFEESIFWNASLPQGVINVIGNLSPPLTVNSTYIAACLASDGTTNSSWFNTTGRFISSSSPVIVNASITPSLAYVNTSALVGLCNATDVDNDTLMYNYTWYKNNISYLSGQNTTGVGQGIKTQTAFLAQGNYTGGDQIIFQCTAFDGGSYSMGLNSSTLTINNSNPTIVTTRIAPTVPYVNDSLYGYCNATDIDGNDVLYNFTWYKNGVTNLTGLFGNTSAQGCFQEFTNVSTTCGGLSNGTYAFAGGFTNQNNAIDGNYSTFANITTVASTIKPVYSIPNGANLNGTTWTIKWGDTPQTDGFSVGNCPNIGGTLKLRIQRNDLVGVSTQAYCENGAGAIVVFLGSVSGSSVYEEAVTWNLTTQLPNVTQGVETLVSTLGAGNLTEGQNWTLQCSATDGSLYSGALNSSVLINNTPPVIQFANVTPSNPNSNTTLQAFCNATDIDINQNVQYYYQWFVNGVGNATGNNTNSTSGVTRNVNNDTQLHPAGTSWLVSCLATDGKSNSSWLNSSAVTIANFAPVAQTSQITPTLAYTNSTLGGYCNISDTDADLLNISYSWYKNSALVTSGTVLNRQSNLNQSVNNYTLLTASDFNTSWIFQCSATDGFTTSNVLNSSVTGVNSLIVYNSAMFANTSSTVQVGDVVSMNGSATSNGTVNTCLLYVNDNSSFYNPAGSNSKITVDNGAPIADYVLPFNFTIRSISTANNSVVQWYIACNDTNHTTFGSSTFSFTVNDTTAPVTTPNQFGTNFNLTSNRSIISKDRYNVTYNVSFADANLFAVEVNITCAIDGPVYYFSAVNISTTTYNKSDTMNLSNRSVQRCTYFTASSDSHTDEFIPEYDQVQLDNGVSFHTEANNTIQIVANEAVADVATEKLTDRYTFDFAFDDSKNTRTFVVRSDKKLYYMPGSSYPAHFVVWNPSTHEGNWIDFDDKINGTIDTYTVERVNDFEYHVIVHTPQATSEIGFNSIGGTLTSNFSASFYLGATLYLNSTNVYDNKSFSNYTFVMTQQSGDPVINLSGTVTPGTIGIIENVTNGTYIFNFTHPSFFAQNYIITVANASQFVNYTSYQGVVNILFRNLKNHLTLHNVSFNVTQLSNLYKYVVASTGNNNYTTIYLNATNYTINWTAPGYSNQLYSYSQIALANTTLILDAFFNANFTLYDEKLSVTTGSDVLFNVSSANQISFLLFCPDITKSEVINTTNFTFFVDCDYSLFKFQLDYGTSSYYRTFILDPDEANNVKVYLIDLATTSAVFNSFIADDLLNLYQNPSIYVLETIGNSTVQITADYTDIENKIGAYLIQNFQYSIEIHSDNLPTQVLGSYAAASSGTQTIRLYNISGSFGVDIYNVPYSYIIATNNDTTPGSNIVYGSYYDNQNITTSVTFNVYANSTSVPIYTATVNDQQVLFTYNATAIFNSSTIYAELVINRVNQSTLTYRDIMHEVTEINLGITQYVSQQTINWFLVILLGTLAIMGTIETANYVSMGIIGLGAVFAIFGWLTVSAGILAIAGLVTLISLLKEGERNS